MGRDSADHIKYSVLISTRNEGEALRRTVEDVMEKAAGSLLEIVVVDDGSTDGSAGLLHSREHERSGVRLIRNETPLGVIQSRALAADAARGEYLCVLDAHCSVEEGWLDRLAASLAAIDNRGLAVPSIWVLDPERWSPDESRPRVTGCTIVNPFLDFSWEDARSIDGRACTCTIGGGAWMARRDWYLHVGGLDRDMLHWGGENIDLPLRTWLAGGMCLVVDDVRVGHLFKKADPTRKPSPLAHLLTYNKLRAAHSVFSREMFQRILENFRDLAGFEEAMALIEGNPESIARLKGRFESIRQRPDEWLIETFELPVLEPPFFYQRPLRKTPYPEHPGRPHPAVSVVIVGSTLRERLPDLTRSLLERTTYSRFRILLACPFSRGSLLDVLPDQPFRSTHRLDVLETTAEARGSTLYNLAALHGESEYIIFLSDDAVLLDENWIEEFILLFERREQLLLASPRIQGLGEDASEAVPPSFDGVWDWDSPGFVRSRCGNPFSEVPYQALTASPTCFAVHRERFLELGGFDRTVTGGDPPLLDLAIHGWLAGYEVFCHPCFRVGRRPGAERQGAPAESDAWIHYSQVLPAIKYFTNPSRIEKCRERSPAARNLLERNRLFLERRRRSFSEYGRFDDDWLFYKFGIEDTSK